MANKNFMCWNLLSLVCLTFLWINHEMHWIFILSNMVRPQWYFLPLNFYSSYYIYTVIPHLSYCHLSLRFLLHIFILLITFSQLFSEMYRWSCTDLFGTHLSIKLKILFSFFTTYVVLCLSQVFRITFYVTFANIFSIQKFFSFSPTSPKITQLISPLLNLSLTLFLNNFKNYFL
jgi:hypothetical protein